MRIILMLMIVYVSCSVSTFGQVARVGSNNTQGQKAQSGNNPSNENNIQHRFYDEDWNPVTMTLRNRTSFYSDTIIYSDHSLKSNKAYYKVVPLNQQGSGEFVIMLAEPFESPDEARPVELPTQQLVSLHGINHGYVKIVDNIGWLVLEETISTAAIDISQLPKGVYWMTIHSDDQVMRQRIIKE